MLTAWPVQSDARARAGDARRAAGARGAGRRAGAHRRGRARASTTPASSTTSRSSRARRCTTATRSLWVLGETPEAARLGAAAVRGRVRAAALADHRARRRSTPESFQGTPRTVRRGDAEAALATAPHVFEGVSRGRRPGALLPRDARVARPRRLRGPGIRRSAARSTRRETQEIVAHVLGMPSNRGHGAVPAHGRRLRRQGDAAARVRGDRRARREAHRPAGAPAAQPHAGHHDDRQAASVPPRRGRPASTTTAASSALDGDAHRRRRLEPRPVGAGAGPRALPHRQRVLDPERASRTAGSRRRTRPRTPRSAGSAGRRACS